MDEFNARKALKFTLTIIGVAIAIFATLALVIWAASVVPVDMNPPSQQINHNNYAQRAPHE